MKTPPASVMEFPGLEPKPKSPRTVTVALCDLPPDSELVGPNPNRAMIDSVERIGVIQPIVVVKNAGGTMDVKVGRRRVKAARAAGLDKVKAIVYPTSKVFRHVACVSENAHRSPNVAADIAAINDLLKLGIPTDQVRQIVGLSRSVFESRLSLLLLIPVFSKMLNQGLISGAVAERIAKLPPSEQEKLAGEVAAHGGITAKMVTEFLKSLRSTAVEELPGSLFGEGAGMAANVTVPRARLAELADTLEMNSPESEAFAAALSELRGLARAG